jgi:hypothetical protein
LAATSALWADALAADPWLFELPVVLTDVRAVPGEPWHVVDEDGHGVALRPYDQPWQLLAVGGGGPVTLSAMVTPAGMDVGGIRTQDGWSTW